MQSFLIFITLLDNNFFVFDFRAHSSLKEKTPLKQHNEKVNGKTVSNKSGGSYSKQIYLPLIEDLNYEKKTICILNCKRIVLIKTGITAVNHYIFFLAKPKIEDMFMKVLEDCQEKPEDETEAFLNHFGVLLRKLPVKIKDRYQRKFTRIVDDTLDELEDGEVDDEFQRRGFKITYD